MLFLDIAFVSRFDVCATGAMYFHRFYMFHSFSDFHRYVCLFHLSVNCSARVLITFLKELYNHPGFLQHLFSCSLLSKSMDEFFKRNF